MPTVDLNVQELGAGSPVIILHGMLGSIANWRGIARTLAERHRVVLADLRNHGASSHATGMDYVSMADDVRALMARLDLPRASIIGHSMGGKTAMALALGEPDIVELLVVVDIAPVTYPSRHAGMVRAMRGLDLSRVARRTDADALLRDAIPDDADRQFVLQNLVQRDGGYVWRINLDEIIREEPNLYGFPDFSGRSWGGPALFIAGGNSNYVLPEYHPIIRSLFPRTRIAVIEGAGHWVHVEKGAVLVDRIRGFLG